MRPYKIVVLGTSGSGKTVFLASLYHQLLEKTEGRGFLLTTDTKRGTKLIQMYAQVANTQGAWPRSTDRSEESEWAFTCRVKSEDESTTYDLLDFIYLDYAGENLTGDISPSLAQAIEEADAFLCLLDGNKLLTLLDTERQGISTLLLVDLPNIIRLINTRKHSLPVPVHFVITKWDLFLTNLGVEDHGSHILAQARKRLLAYDLFQNFVHQRLKRAPVRFIPISSVGRDFARPEVQPDGKTVMKKTGKDASPLLVEMPLICVLPDLFKIQTGLLDQRKKDLREEPLSDIPKMSLKNSWKRAAAAFIRTIGKALPLALAPSASSSVVYSVALAKMIDKDFLEPLAALFEQGPKAEELAGQERLKQLEKEREERIKAVQDQQGAIASLVFSFGTLFKQFEHDFPASDFSRPVE